MTTVAVLGTLGIPAAYGGFETLAENLAVFHQSQRLPSRLVVYCSAKAFLNRPETYLDAKLRYVGLNANGVSSILYDLASLLSAIRSRTDVILLLGVSGAVVLPLVRFISRARIVTNIDGLEWKRAKWNRLARWFLKLSERMAVRYSHVVIADNPGIAEHVANSYGRKCRVIAYGGDHAVAVPAKTYDEDLLPAHYALALCRIEPENNVAMVLEAFASDDEVPLVFVGNWHNSKYGRDLHQRFSGAANIYLLDPIYDVGVLRTVRGQAALYIHGHSAGGTNPSLVEMMHFGLPILAYDCIYNRHSTNNKAAFFRNAEQLKLQLQSLDRERGSLMGAELKRIAQERYTWAVVGRAYFDVLMETNED